MRMTLFALVMLVVVLLAGCGVVRAAGGLVTAIGDETAALATRIEQHIVESQGK